MYKESIWTFSLRMAGRVGAFITPNNRSDTPQLLVGLPKREAIVISNKEIVKTEEKVLEFDRNYKAPSSKQSAMKQAAYQIMSNYDLSDTLTYDGIDYLVTKKQIIFGKGEFLFYYTLVDKMDMESLFMQPFSNEKLCGLSLRGTVVKRNPKGIKVHLDIDSSPSTAVYWFNHDTAAMSGFQGIPELNTEVWLYVNGEDEPYVEHSIHHLSSRHKDHRDRSFENRLKKSMYLLQDQISVVTEGDSVRLSDHQGVSARTDKKLILTAKKDIKIKTHNKLRITTPEYFKASKKGKFSGLEIYSK